MMETSANGYFLLSATLLAVNYSSYPGLEMDKRAEVATHGMTPPTPTEAHEATEAAKAGGVRVVGQSLPHASGARHTTGEAHYTDDTPLPPGTLHGWLVRAAKAPATLEAIDASEAKAAPGVEAVLLAADLPTGGNNKMGPLKQDEWCFAEGARRTCSTSTSARPPHPTHLPTSPSFAPFLLRALCAPASLRLSSLSGLAC